MGSAPRHDVLPGPAETIASPTSGVTIAAGCTLCPATTDDLAEAMKGKVRSSRRASAPVDETPAAHKDIDHVMADRDDLVAVHHSLRQVLDDKGT